MLHLVYVVLRIEPRASCLLSQQPTSRAPPRVLHALYLFLQEKAVVGSTGSCLRECWEAISRQHSWNHTAPLQAPSTENAKKQKQKTKTEQNQQQQQQQQNPKPNKQQQQKNQQQKRKVVIKRQIHQDNFCHLLCDYYENHHVFH